MTTTALTSVPWRSGRASCSGRRRRVDFRLLHLERGGLPLAAHSMGYDRSEYRLLRAGVAAGLSIRWLQTSILLVRRTWHGSRRRRPPSIIRRRRCKSSSSSLCIMEYKPRSTPSAPQQVSYRPINQRLCLIANLCHLGLAKTKAMSDQERLVDKFYCVRRVN